LKLTGFGDDPRIPRQKNWMPFWYQQQLFFVYSWCPLAIVHCDTETGLVTLVSLDIPPVLSEWRGSAPPLEIPPHLLDGSSVKSSLPGGLSALTPRKDYTLYLGMTHESSWSNNPRKPNYTRLFVVFAIIYTKDHTWRYPFYSMITHVSPVFRFDTQQPVEFVTNIAWDNDTIIIPYGSRDEKCFVTQVSWKELSKQLLPIVQ
jgi:hypothetical protein